MNRSRRIKLGVGLLSGGLVVLGIDMSLSTGVFAVMGLVVLLLVPPIVALVGAVVLLTGLARTAEPESRSHTFGRIIAIATVGGVSLGLVLLIVGTIMLVPRWAEGYTGMFGAGFGVGVGAILEIGIGLLAGAGAGVVAASIWWLVRGHLLPASARWEDAPSAYAIPPVN